MPRDGNGVAFQPANTTGGPSNTPISSSKYNAVNADIYQLFNTPAPFSAGGTNASTAIGAADNLSAKGADIASSATTDIGAATGRYVHITGTTTITSFGTKTAGVVRILTFDGSLTLTHNATSLILPGAANILTAAGDVAVLVSEGGGNWRCVSYTRASGADLRTIPGHIFGLTVTTNGSDAANDIDIAAGEAASDAATPVLLTLASALTKRIDASWAVGTGNGGLDTGAVGNNTYYIWLIQRSDTGVTDALFSLSSTAPTLPTNYDRKRLIGYLKRVSGVNSLPIQRGIIDTVYSGPTLLTSQATTSGSSKDFVIPSWATKVIVTLADVSTTGTSSVIIRLGTGGSPDTTGYRGTVNFNGTNFEYATGTGFFDGTNSSGNRRHGAYHFTLVDPATNTWAMNGGIGLSDLLQTGFGFGSKALSGKLDIVRVFTPDAFDAGVVNVLYE